MSGRVLGIDLGGTKTAVAVVRDGTVLARDQVDTPQSGFTDVVQAIARASLQLLQSAGPVRAAGLGSPGPLDFETGTIRWAPNIVGLENAPIVRALEAELGLPVTLENDANAAGFAEHRYGAARGLPSSVFVTISTGIGGGLFLGDQVIRGAHGLAGEIGHMTLLPGGPVGGDGHLGTLESIAAGRSMERDAGYGFGSPVGNRVLFERAREGDPMALRIIDNAAEFTGIGLANIVKIFDPAAFVLGGGLTNAGDFYLDRIRQSFARHMTNYPLTMIRLAQLGADAGVIGAAAVAEVALLRTEGEPA